MTTEDAKSYLSKRDIPCLFESLMTGLMYHRPQDHIKYLIDCLHKVNEKGQGNLTWSSFVDMRRNKTPLPPIGKETSRPTSSKGSRPTSRTRTPKEENAPREKTSSPLPAIPTSTTAEKINMPDKPVVLVMGAPGSGKNQQVEKLLTRYPGWTHVNVGRLIKEEIKRRGDAHAKWKLTRDLLSRGEAAPQDITIEVVLDGVKNAVASANGLVISGYPRNMEQVAEYSKFISRIDCVFMMDCDEAKAMDKLLRKGRNSNRPEDSMTAITNRMNYFKAHTLEVGKHYDDLGKLVVIDCDADEDIVKSKFGESFDQFFCKDGSHTQDVAPPGSADLPEPATYKKKHEVEEEEAEAEDAVTEEETPLFIGQVPEPAVITEKDTGRKPDLPTCPIIFVAGGPGSGKGTQCERIIQRYPGFVHLSMGEIIRTEISTKGTADDKWDMISSLVSRGDMAPEEVTVDLLKEQLKKNSSAKAFVLEGFPRDNNQVEAFNKHIGGLSFVILFDCEEYYMQTRLLKRGRDSGRIDDNPTAIANRIKFYKYNTLPVLKYFEEEDKLVVRNIADMDADKDMDSLFYEISRTFDFAFYGTKPGDESKAQGSTVTYITEVKANKDDVETTIAAMKIKAGFEGGKKRQQKVLRRGASYSSKYESSDDNSDKPKKEQDEKRKAADQPKVETSPTEEDEDQRAAAERIQAGFRGYQTRQSLEAKRQQQQKPTELENSQAQDEKEAAERIQAGFRGYKTRQEFEKKHEQENKKPDLEAAPVQDEVVEESITQATANTTGDNIANPSHTKALDEAAES